MPEVQTWIGVTMDVPLFVEVQNGHVAVLTQAWGEHNEDSACLVQLRDGSTVIGVADGAGGLAGGAEASSAAVRAFVKALVESEDATAAILDGFEQANDAVRDLGRGATTLAVAQLGATGVRTYHAGDSQCVVYGGRGKIKLQTIPHTPLGFAVEAGVDPSAELEAQRHLVSNLLGNTPLRVETTTGLPLAQLDTVLVGSDGLFDNLTTLGIADYLRRRSLDVVAATLLDTVHARMRSGLQGSKPDDLTFLLYRRE